MQILLLTHYFEPENGAPQRRWAALIERLVGAGHEVHVIAPPPHYPTGRAEAGLERALQAGSTTTGSHGGVVHRVSFLRHNSSIVSRTVDHAWVARASIATGIRLVRGGVLRPDVIVATAPGLPSLVAGTVLARRLHVPLVAEMRDAWPDLVSHTPGLSIGHGPAARVKRRVHAAITSLQKGAAIVVTTTESFASVLRARGISRVEVIRNGTSLARYCRIPQADKDHPELRVLYMGTVGRSQGLEATIRAAAIARDAGVNLAVRIVGYGADLRKLRALNSTLGCPVEILGRVEAHEVFQHYAWADTTIVSLRDWEPFEWTVPSKLYELLATGKHITAIVSGEAARIVGEAGAGDVVQPGDAEAIAGLWARLAGDRSRLATQDGGRRWVAENADFDVIGERYRILLERAAAV